MIQACATRFFGGWGGILLLRLAITSVARAAATLPRNRFATGFYEVKPPSWASKTNGLRKDFAHTSDFR